MRIPSRFYGTLVTSCNLEKTAKYKIANVWIFTFMRGKQTLLKCIYFFYRKLKLVNVLASGFVGLFLFLHGAKGYKSSWISGATTTPTMTTLS